MFDENQLVEIKCSPKTKEHYIEKGYNYTKKGDSLLVKASDLTSGSNARIEVKCDYCGKLYYPTYINYMKRTNKDVDACSECRTKKGASCTLSQRRKDSFKRIKEICEQKDYTLLTDESEFVNGYTVITYMCKKHGVKTSTIYDMLSGKGCRDCGYEKNAKEATLDCSYVKDEIEKYNGNKLLNPEDYIGSRIRNLKILCKCGRRYTTSFNEYISSNIRRCPTCSSKESYGEFLIRTFLEDRNISFEQEKRFDDCRDKLPLPFDFYLFDYNLIVEFDGKHHYEDVNLGDYKTTVYHDNIKNEYCASHNINLLRIPYWEIDNIEQILKDKLCL